MSGADALVAMFTALVGAQREDFDAVLDLARQVRSRLVGREG